MGEVGGCIEFVSAMNTLFTTALILNDGHEIYAVLKAGGDPLEEAGKKFPENEQLQAFLEVKRGWPAHHMEAIYEMLRWALSKLDTDERITVHWKGDAQASETVTRFELRDHTLVVELAHPPVAGS